jgi:hypothetical protein
LLFFVELVSGSHEALSVLDFSSGCLLVSVILKGRLCLVKLGLC